MNSLSNLLAHEIVDLYSAEEQIIDALPQMIEKAQNQELKKALEEHLRVTEKQKKRLEKVHKLIQQQDDSDEELGDTECKGMKGLIEEGQKAMKEDMEPEVMDAAIIACAQKIEHYEISGYGTARAFARELGMSEVEKLLSQTLDEEYEADDLLTTLAVGKEDISVKKLPASRSNSRSKASASRSTSRASSNGTTKRSSGARKSRTKKSSTASRGSKSTSSKSKNSSRSRSKSRAR